MIGDMELAGFTRGTQQAYLGAVVKLQDHYGIHPGKLTEKQVQQYIFWLRDEKGVAKGFHKVRYYGLWHPCKRDRQARARLLLERATPAAGQRPPAFMADIVDEALGKGEPAPQDHAVQCPKCGSANLCRIKTRRRRNPMPGK